MQRFLYRSNHICSSLLRPHRGLQFLAGNVRMYATSEHVIDVNESNFDEYVVRSPVPVLVDVYADWCGPCKQLSPILEKVANNFHGQFKVAKLNADKNENLSGELGVKVLPTLIGYKDGKRVGTAIEGYKTEMQLVNYIMVLFGLIPDKPKNQKRKDPKDMTISELKQEIKELGMNPSIFLERVEMIDVITKGRK